MKKEKSKNLINKNHQNSLSIQFSLDGFSFCVSDFESKEIGYFSSYQFDETCGSLENLLERIKIIFNDDAVLHLHFKSVFVIHQNNLNVLVPNDYFDENKLKDYLNFNIKTLQTDFISFDTIENLRAQNVFIPYININNYLFQNFGEFEYKHHSSILLEKLIQKNHSHEKTMYINISRNLMDIVVLEHKKLILFNSFHFETKEDFIYYILFVAEQLQLDNEKFNLYFTGEITLKSDVYKIAFSYIRNVFFLESETSIFENLEVPKHSNFILLG